MSNSQGSKSGDICLLPEYTFGYTMDYRLLGTYTDTPFFNICNELATCCHCNMSLLPDLRQEANPLNASFKMAYGRLDMVGAVSNNRYSSDPQLTVLLVQNCTRDFSPSGVPPLQFDIFGDEQEQDKCYLLNVAGYFLQKWDIADLTCLCYVFADKGKNTPLFVEHFQNKMPYFNEDLTSRLTASAPTVPSRKKNNSPTPQKFLYDIVNFAQRLIKDELHPRSPIFPKKQKMSLIS